MTHMSELGAVVAALPAAPAGRLLAQLKEQLHPGPPCKPVHGHLPQGRRGEGPWSHAFGNGWAAQAQGGLRNSALQLSPALAGLHVRRLPAPTQPALRTGKFSLGACKLESGRPKAKTVVEAPRCCWKAASAGMVAPAAGRGARTAHDRGWQRSPALASAEERPVRRATGSAFPTQQVEGDAVCVRVCV